MQNSGLSFFPEVCMQSFPVDFDTAEPKYHHYTPQTKGAFNIIVAALFVWCSGAIG